MKNRFIYYAIPTKEFNRDQAIFHSVMSGYSMPRVGEKFGITRERVSQIIKDQVKINAPDLWTEYQKMVNKGQKGRTGMMNFFRKKFSERTYG